MDTSNLTHALALRPLQPPPDELVRHTTPVRGNFRTVMDLDDDVGVHADIFWRMFTFCRGCKHIMTGRRFPDHICDLTHL